MIQIYTALSGHFSKYFCLSFGYRKVGSDENIKKWILVFDKIFSANSERRPETTNKAYLII